MNNSLSVLNEYNCKYSFWKLLSEYKIEIPIIQRDYAQGRKSENISAIRYELLESIYEALVYNESLDFDFVYGTVEGEKLLYPLDGQQRLTTFYLLHWYLSQKENRIEEIRETLSNFSYTTRISSRDFCELLVSLDYYPEEGEPVSKYIKNENGYFRSWDNDPTINAMLTMLDAIHEKFFKCEPLLDKLLNDNALLTFNYLPMEHYSLTDDLYIKMNARGKALSDFENFKAKFIQHLRNNGLPYAHFEESIDGKWVDLLWDYRSRDNTIDKQFMNLFSYCTEMLFLWSETPQECESPFRTQNIRKLVEYYDSEEKVKLLYSLFDLWQNQKEAKECLENIFSSERNIGRVRLFDGHPDIFSDIVNGSNVTVMNKILLFVVMRRLIKLGKDSDSIAMLDFARISRNLLIKNRFFSKSKVAYLPDFRFGRNGIPYTAFITTYLCESESPYETICGKYTADYHGVNEEIYKQESKKANLIVTCPGFKSLIQQLEDLDIFKGSVFNIMSYVIEHGNDSLVEKLENLFTSINSDSIIAALLSINDYTISITNSRLGNKYFLGNKESWYEILTYSGDEQYATTITSFIEQYLKSDAETIDDRIKEIINNNLPSIDVDDWRYCLIKYPSTIKDNISMNNKKFILVYESTENGFVLHRVNGTTLNSIHVVPEYLEVKRQLGDECYLYYGQNSDESGEINLRCVKGTSITWNGEGITVSYNSDIADKELIDQAINEYDKTIEDGKDIVEKMVYMAKVFKDISSKQ